MDARGGARAPDVPEPLWQAAHARIAESRLHYHEATKGQRGGRPKDVDSKYLLPGFARCGCCSGGLHVRSGNHGSAGNRRRVFAYACTAHFNRGVDVCRNALRVRMEAAGAAVMAAIGDVVTADLVDDVIGRVRELLDPTVQGGSQRQQLDDELVAAEREVGHLADAIAAGGEMRALARRLQEAERRRQTAATTLEALPAAAPSPRSIGATSSARRGGGWRIGAGC